MIVFHRLGSIAFTNNSAENNTMSSQFSQVRKSASSDLNPLFTCKENTCPTERGKELFRHCSLRLDIKKMIPIIG